MRLRKILFILLLLCPCALMLQAQVSIQFIPEVYGRTLNGLFNARILNTGGQNNVRLTITVKEKKMGGIVTVQTAPFTLFTGNNLIPNIAVRSATVRFANGQPASAVSQTGYFPQGEYEFSFDLFSTTSGSELISSEVYSYDLTPSAPLELLEPYDKDNICEKRPLLSWQPSVPYIPGMYYQLQLAEIKERQNAVEALNYNLPVINLSSIPNTILPYPPSSKNLEEGKKYAWQVTAYKDQVVINRSDVWEFTMDCKDSVETPLIEDNGYRDIEDLLKGNYYVAAGAVKFALINPYKEQPLSYTILCITDPSKKVRRLPKVKLKNGKNKVGINLSGNSSFRDGYAYLLTLKMPDGSSKKLRFVYKEMI